MKSQVFLVVLMSQGGILVEIKWNGGNWGKGFYLSPNYHHTPLLGLGVGVGGGKRRRCPKSCYSKYYQPMSNTEMLSTKHYQLILSLETFRVIWCCHDIQEHDQWACLSEQVSRDHFGCCWTWMVGHTQWDNRFFLNILEIFKNWPFTTDSLKNMLQKMM